jgi:hypothetical protein
MVKCTFVSVWDDGNEIRTSATYNPKTGSVDAKTTDDVQDLDHLDREFIVLNEGTDQEEELEVCTTCHEYVMKPVMVESSGDRHSLVEDKECSDPDCESH